ncbi:MAG: c-type cytochrome [Usitatibacter sp.]
MSDPHHHDAIEDNIETHPLKLAIGIVLGAVALIVGIILVVQYAIGSYGSRSVKNDPSMSDEAVAKRLAPVALVVVEPNAPVAPTAAPAAAVPAAAIPAAPAKVADAAPAGKATYDTVCTACHATGVAGAPKFGDKAAWAARLKAGKPSLYASVLKGKGAMPAKGGNPSLSDDAVRAAADYMLAAAK